MRQLVLPAAAATAIRAHEVYSLPDECCGLLAGEADELMASDRTEEAGGLYLRAAELAPESDELLFWAGLAQVHAGDVQTGMAAVRRAIELHPGWFTLLERLSPDFAPAGERVRRELASS